MRGRSPEPAASCLQWHHCAGYPSLVRFSQAYRLERMSVNARHAREVKNSFFSRTKENSLRERNDVLLNQPIDEWNVVLSDRAANRRRLGYAAYNLVTKAAHGDDLRRCAARLAELDPQPPDVHVDRAAGSGIRVTPHELGQGVARHNLIGP